MLLVSSCRCLFPIRWSHVLSWEWRCSWSSADRRCSDYIWVINNLIAYWSASPASQLFTQPFIQTQIKENTKARRHWSFCREFTGDQGICGKCSIWWHHHEITTPGRVNPHPTIKKQRFSDSMHSGLVKHLSIDEVGPYRLNNGLWPSQHQDII